MNAKNEQQQKTIWKNKKRCVSAYLQKYNSFRRLFWALRGRVYCSGLISRRLATDISQNISGSFCLRQSLYLYILDFKFEEILVEFFWAVWAVMRECLDSFGVIKTQKNNYFRKDIFQNIFWVIKKNKLIVSSYHFWSRIPYASLCVWGSSLYVTVVIVVKSLNYSVILHQNLSFLFYLFCLA